MVTAATNHSGALVACAVSLMLSGILMVPAVGGLLHQARDRGAALTNLAAALGVLGGFGHFAIGMFYLVALALPGGDQNEMTAYIERLNDTPALGAIAFPLILSFALGVLAMAWAAWRTGLIGWWGPIAVTAVVILHEALPDQPAVDRNRRPGRAHRRLWLSGHSDRQTERRRMGSCSRSAWRVRTRHSLTSSTPLVRPNQAARWALASQRERAQAQLANRCQP